MVASHDMAGKPYPAGGWLLLESVLCTTKPSWGPGPHNSPKAGTPGSPWLNPNPTKKIQGYSLNPGP